jgi:hypothetical protein
MWVTKLRQAQQYRNVGGDGGEGSGAAGIDLNSPAVKAAIQAAIDAEVAGLKNKNSELIGKLKETSEKFKQYEGVDFEKLKVLQKQMEGNEELRLLSEGKTEEVIARRIENAKKDYENQLAARDGKLSEYEQILKQKEDRLASLVIDGQIREAYVGLGYEPAALDDILRLGRDVFIMDENGSAVPRDAQGNIIFGKDAKSPVTAAEWLANLAEKKPYLRGVNKGAGTQPNRNTGKVDTSKMTSTQRIAEGLRQLGRV